MNFKRSIAAIVAAVLTVTLSARAEWIVEKGEVLAFLGDSITQQGQTQPVGYVNLVLQTLAKEGVEIKPVKAGISGHKSNDMLNRLDRDVLSKGAKVMTLSCGVNDVWHQDSGRGVSLEDYKKNVTEILDKCAASNCTVVVMTASMFQYRGWEKDPHNVKLAPYNDFLREIAAERKLPLADINKAMWDAYAADPGGKLTADGVHMRWPGNFLMAKCILVALGADPAKLADYEKDWRTISGGAEMKFALSLDEMEKLDAAAAKMGEGDKAADFVRVRCGLTDSKGKVRETMPDPVK